MTPSKKKTVKAWAIIKGRTFSHVEFDKQTAETWEGFKIVPCIITYKI